MWAVKNRSNRKQYFLPCNKDVIVGRKEADIVVSGDSSVSRKHGTLRVTHSGTNLKNPDLIPTLTYTDCSKFGTFYTRGDGEKTKVDGNVSLKPGDVIQFGAHDSIFELVYSPLVITTSMLENDVKQKLGETLISLGGHMVSNWHESVTHLVVENIKLSVKVAQALVNACHIITPDFVFNLKNILGIVATFPDAEEYMPRLEEPNLSQEHCSFKVDKKRKNIFKDKVVIFLSKKQQKRMGPVIVAGGGKSFGADDPAVNDDLISNPQTSVVNCGNTEPEDLMVNNSQYQHLQETLLINDLRLIGEHEIGLAVLYCDASLYCNPGFDLNSQNAFTQRHPMPPNPEGSCADLMPPDEQPSTSKIVMKKETSSGYSSGIKSVGSDDHPMERNHTFKKRSRSPEILQENPETSGESLNKKAKTAEHQVAETVEDDALDDIPDSYLDDDALWSQNFDSASYIRQEKSTSLKQPKTENITVEEIPTTKRSELRMTERTSGPKQASADPEVKPEPVSPPEQPFVNLTGRKQEHNNEDRHQKNEPRSPTVNSEDQVAFRRSDLAFPLGLAQIERVSLVVEKKQIIQSHVKRGVKNFKRFRKVWPTYLAPYMSDVESVSSHPRVPHIIGGSDFYVDGEEQEKTRGIDEWFDQGDVESSNPFLKTLPSHKRRR